MIGKAFTEVRAQCDHKVVSRAACIMGFGALRLAHRIEPNKRRLMASWYNDEIAALDRLTACELVRRGSVRALENYFLEIIEGKRG